MFSCTLATKATDYTQHLSIVLGSVEKRSYIVHKEFILHHSSVLNSYYEKSCKSFETGTIEVPDSDDFESMQVLVNWCYKGESALVEPAVNPKRDG